MLPMHGHEGYSTLSSTLKDCTYTIHPHLLSHSIILYPSLLSRSQDTFCYLLLAADLDYHTLSTPPIFFPIYPHVWLFAPHPSHSHFLCVSLKTLSLSPNHRHFVDSQLLLYSLDPPSDFCLSLRSTSFLSTLLLPQLPSTLLGNTTVVPPSPCSLAVKSTLLFQHKKKRKKKKSSDVSFSVLAALHGP